LSRAVFIVAYFDVCGRLRFAAEAGERFARVSVITQDSFHRNDTTGVALPRAIDDAHPSPSDFLEDLIIAEPPLAVADIDVGEHLIERFGAVGIGFQTALEQAIQTGAASDT
jgi:hypothetical protein